MKGSMTLKHRKNIVRESKSRISKEIKDYNDKEVGERETILDEYIEKICIEKGWELSHFYFEEGNILNKLLK
jgi:hypothetical protein